LKLLAKNFFEIIKKIFVRKKVAFLDFGRKLSGAKIWTNI
jgi:hypothetical protein